MIILNESNFISQVKQTPLILVEFYAEWCVPCMRMGKVLEKLDHQIKNDSLILAKVDIDECQRLDKKMNIENTPTLILVKDSKIIGRMEGFKPLHEVRRFVVDAINHSL